jgi:integrative and conjugative element protein (TIGR02256 family)
MSLTVPAAWRLPNHDDEALLPAAWRLGRKESAAARPVVTTVVERDRDGHESAWRSNGEVENLTPMLQATRPFTALYDGERVQITSDTRVCVDHEIARSNPSMFRPVGVHSRSRSRVDTATLIHARGLVEAKTRALQTATAKRSRSLSTSVSKRDDDDVVFRAPRTDGKWWLEKRGPITVSLHSSVRESIACECERWQDHDDVETGGPLAGVDTGSHLRVTVARPGGPESWHGKNRVTIPLESFKALARECKVEQSDATILGDWHTHPAGYDRSRPSAPDRRAWAAEFEQLRRDRGATAYLGLIVTPSRRFGWAAQTLHAWILRRDGTQVICEAATIR